MQLGYLKIFLFLMAAIALAGSAFKILKEYERAVVFRLGKLHGTKGPGLIFLIPLIDRIMRIDLRLVSIDVPRQDIMTRDNVPVTVDAVVYFNIADPAKAIVGIQNIYQSTFLIAQTTLRSILGQMELDDLLSQQAKINHQLQQVISVHTDPWGIKIPIVEIKEVTLPDEMKRVMAKQAETERERRAKVIDAQGEYQIAQTLAEAGKILSNTPQSLQLRYLQTLRDISTQKASTIIFPFPLDMVGPFIDKLKGFVSSPLGHEIDPTFRKIGADSPEVEAVSKSIQLPEPRVIAESGVTMEIKRDDLKESKIQPQPSLSQTSIPAPPPSIPAPPPPQQEWLTRYQKEWRDGRLKPQYVQWISTDRCQFNCAHCETTAKKISNEELSTNEVQKMLDDLAELGCQFLSITGGEPLLRPDIFSLAQYAHQRGISVGLTTNGHATEEHLMSLEQARFDSLVITMDGYGQTQNRMRGNSESYEHGIRTIEFFHDLGAPSISVSTILLEENLRELPQLTEEAFKAGAHSLQIQPLLFYQGQPARNSSDDVKTLFRFILEAGRRGFAVEIGEAFGYLGMLEPLVRNNPFFCGCGWNTFCITHQGDVFGCALSKTLNLKEGDIRKSSLKSIWEEKFNTFRRNLPSPLVDGCQECPHLSLCRGGCWLFRAQGLNPCFLPEAEQVYQEVYALYSQAIERKS